MSRDFFKRNAQNRAEERRREEAAQWFVTLQDSELSDRVLQRWQNWESVPENRAAFDAVERIWQLVDEVPELPAAGPEERAEDSYDGSVPVAHWRAKSRIRVQNSHVPGFVGRAVGLAAALAVAVIGVIEVAKWEPFVGLFASTPPHRTVVVETGLAEHKQIVFEDGTRIHVGAQTSLTASFSANTRSIELEQGEASFQVAKDPKRPFEVSAGVGTITAVGTAFNVQRRQDDDVVVSVSEGTVEVAPELATVEHTGILGQSERPSALRVTRGQEVTYDATGTMGPIRRADVDESMAWRNGYFRYTQESLRHVIEDINRYSHQRLVLADPAAGELLYSGTVFTTDIDEWIAGLEKTYPQIQVVANEESRAVIRMRMPVAARNR